MSSPAEKVRPESDRKRPSRTRKPAGEKGPLKAAEKESGSSPTAVESAPREHTPRERPPRTPSAPVPEGMLGKTVTGVVQVVIKKGKFNFGFISIGEGGEGAPSIYFNPSCLSDSKLYLRKGYEVEYEIAKDEENRFTAKDIKLTAAGEQLKIERDAAYQARKAERLVAAPAETAAPTAEAKEKPARVRKPRAPAPEGTPLALRASCQGKADEKLLNVHNLISIGRLKGLATQAFEAPLSYNVFYVPSDGSDMVFLTRAVLATMVNDSKIHLAEPKVEA